MAICWPISPSVDGDLEFRGFPELERIVDHAVERVVVSRGLAHRAQQLFAFRDIPIRDRGAVHGRDDFLRMRAWRREEKHSGDKQPHVRAAGERYLSLCLFDLMQPNIGAFLPIFRSPPKIP